MSYKFDQEYEVYSHESKRLRFHRIRSPVLRKGLDLMLQAGLRIPYTWRTGDLLVETIELEYMATVAEELQEQVVLLQEALNREIVEKEALQEKLNILGAK